MKTRFTIMIMLVLMNVAVLAADYDEPLTWSRDIRDVTDHYCADCHCIIYRFLCDYESMMSYVSETNEKTTGTPLIVPGKPDSSVLIWRIEGELPSGEAIDIMPEGFDTLSVETVETFREWIRQGAVKEEVAVRPTRWGRFKSLFR